MELPPGVVEGSPEVLVGSITPSPTATSTASEDCSNEAAIAADPARQVGTSLRADLDGDGVEDTLRLAADPAGPEGCSNFVVAELGAGDVVSAPVWEIGPEGGLPEPQIHGVADLDGRPGAEIIVDEAAGASTQFVGAFMVVDGDLERITVRGGLDSATGAGIEDLFPYGGSAGHIEAVDCAGDGRVVVSTGAPSSDQAEMAEGIYEVERRFFTFDDATLTLAETVRTELPIDELQEFPEYSASPFGSC